jgi:hypothetical protein
MASRLKAPERVLAIPEHKRDPDESGKTAHSEEKAAVGDRHPRTIRRMEFCRLALCGRADGPAGLRASDWPLVKFKNLAKVVAIWVALGDLRRGPAFLKRISTI